jgi:hypothetical protein
MNRWPISNVSDDLLKMFVCWNTLLYPVQCTVHAYFIKRKVVLCSLLKTIMGACRSPHGCAMVFSCVFSSFMRWWALRRRSFFMVGEKGGLTESKKMCEKTAFISPLALRRNNFTPIRPLEFIFTLRKWRVDAPQLIRKFLKDFDSFLNN